MIVRTIYDETLTITDGQTIKQMNCPSKYHINKEFLQRIENKPDDKICILCHGQWYILDDNYLNKKYVKQIKLQYYSYNAKMLALFNIIFNSCLTIYFVLFYSEFFILFRNMNTGQCSGILLIDILIIVLWFCFLAYRSSNVLELK